MVRDRVNKSSHVAIDPHRHGVSLGQGQELHSQTSDHGEDGRVTVPAQGEHGDTDHCGTSYDRSEDHATATGVTWAPKGCFTAALCTG